MAYSSLLIQKSTFIIWRTNISFFRDFQWGGHLFSAALNYNTATTITPCCKFPLAVQLPAVFVRLWGNAAEDAQTIKHLLKTAVHKHLASDTQSTPSNSVSLIFASLMGFDLNLEGSRLARISNLDCRYLGKLQLFVALRQCVMTRKPRCCQRGHERHGVYLKVFWEGNGTTPPSHQ